MTRLKKIIGYFGGLCGISLGFLIGEWHMFLTILLIMQGLDILTGLAKAFYLGILSSHKISKGMIKKAMVWVVIIIANFIDAILFDGSSVVRMGVVFMYIAMEGLSIVESLAEMDVLVPDEVKKYLGQIKDKGSKEMEKDKEVNNEDSNEIKKDPS